MIKKPEGCPIVQANDVSDNQDLSSHLL